MNKKGFIEIFAILFIILVFTLMTLMVYENISFGSKQGIVIDKEYHSSWISYTSNRSIMIPIIYPQSWSIKIKKENKELWIDVSESEYNQINIGDCYQCRK